MKVQEIEAAVSRHQAELHAMGVKTLEVFGSVARGEATPGSDIDLLVEFDRPIGLLHFVKVQQRLSELFGGIEVDLILRDSVIEELRQDIYTGALNVLRTT